MSLQKKRGVPKRVVFFKIKCKKKMWKIKIKIMLKTKY